MAEEEKTPCTQKHQFPLALLRLSKFHHDDEMIFIVAMTINS